MSANGIQKLCVLVLSLFAAPAALAINNSTQNASNQSGWKFEIAPYIWALNMNGTVQAGPARAHVDQSFSDILSQLNLAAMLWMTASKDKFGIFGNVIYSALSNSFSDKFISVKTKNDFGIFSGGLSYQIFSADVFNIEPYAGFRYTTNKATVTLNSALINLHNSNNQSWTDPIIGARLNFNLTKTWHITLAGDIGGTNASSQYSYNVSGVVGFKPQTMWTRTTWYLGYRLLDQHYITGNGANYFNWNMKLAGPLAGVSFTF